MSLIFATQLAAVATAVLAVFAVVTGIYAVRAFRKQSQEVSDQASMLGIQSEQLTEQRKVNAEQIRVLALQAAELRESLEERKRDAVERRNAQAARVSIIRKLVYTAPKRIDIGFRMNVTVVNANEPKQPVYDVKLWWYSCGEPYGMENPEIIGTVLDEDHRFRDFGPGCGPDVCGAILTFRDAARVNWIRTADGDIMTGESELAFDIAKALYEGSGLDAFLPRVVPSVKCEGLGSASGG